MLFDDRLATVLRSPAQGEAAARTQYRQLLDLLGTMPGEAAGTLVGDAYERLGELAEALPPPVQSAILRAPGLRLRNRALVAWLADGEPQAAAAAMATAQLDEDDWCDLIPRLSMTARGFLRHRRDLPAGARQVLDRLGVKDLVLPQPTGPVLAQSPLPGELPADDLPAEAEAGIGALVRRIEAFQRARRTGAGAPQLPLGDVSPDEPGPRDGAFDFATDAEGIVVWADPAMAPLAVGMRLGEGGPAATVALDLEAAKAMRRRLPLYAARIAVVGPPEIAGHWRLDAAPAFTPETGAFVGYLGRMRRPGRARPDDAGVASTAERMRQLLHELRTPVNAIQGFAELIQQQMFGPAPNEYRALAAAVAVDAARLLAGFDEIDRLARLESHVLTLVAGRSDMRDVVSQLLHRLEGVLRPRSARIELGVSGTTFATGLDEGEAQQLAWRLLATLAGALAPGEVIDLTLASDGEYLSLTADLPVVLLGEEDLFAAIAGAQPRTVSAGMFGTGFTLRLARAEAVAAGGSLERRDDTLRLTLPVLTGPAADHTLGRDEGGASA